MSIAKLDEVELALAQVQTITDARKLLLVASSLTSAASKVYWSTNKISECNEDKERAHQNLLRAGEIKLKVEARLGELIQAEQEAGRLATKGRPEKCDSVVTFKDVGLTRKDSQRAKMVANNKELIAEVIEEAEKHGDAPTRQALEKKVKKKKEKTRLEQRNEELKNVEKLRLPDGLTPLLGDFSEAGIPKDSVQLILTDPPYLEENLPLWDKLAEFAEKVLVPGGYLITYCGHYHLPVVLEKLQKYLSYFWIVALTQKQNRLVHSRHVYCEWKPIIIFNKPPLILPAYFGDVVNGNGREKENHEWQQGLSELEPLIEKFCPPNGIILDPCAGSGTTLVAAKKLGRKAIGIEINPVTFAEMKRRLSEEAN